MTLTPTEERSIFKHPLEAVLAALLLVSLLFTAPERANQPATEHCAAATGAGCATAP